MLAKLYTAILGPEFGAERCSGLIFVTFSTKLLRGRVIGGQGQAAHGAGKLNSYV